MRYLLVLTLTGHLTAQTTIRLRIGASTISIPLERYVSAVLAGESSIFRSDEALKAMAVAARTYAVRQRGRHSPEGFDFCATTHCQRAEPGAITPRLESIASATAGELLWFEGKPAFTPYTRDCGGRTEDAAAVWPDLAAPYLKSRDDPHGAAMSWHWSGDPARIAEALRHSQLHTPPRVERVSIAGRTESGRARALVLSGAGQSVRIDAGSFRFAIGRELGWNTILSDRYEIRDGTFIGQGAGHGVGMCQRGADRLGVEGQSYYAILKYYYPGTAPGLTAQGLTWHRLGGGSFSVFSTRPDHDREVLPLMEYEAQAACARTKSSLPLAIEIRIYPDVETFRNATGEPGWVAAYTSGRRIHLQPVGILRQRNALEQTLRHEMLHVVVEANAVPGLPLWFREGLVEYLAGAHAAAAAAPPADSELRQTEDQPRARRAYASAASAVSTLVKRYGETAVLGWLETGLPAEVKRASNSQEATKSK